MWLKATQLYFTEKGKPEVQRFGNLINLDEVKRIVFVPGEPEAEVYFKGMWLGKKDEQYEDWVRIEIKDKKGFTEKFKDLIDITQ